VAPLAATACSPAWEWEKRKTACSEAAGVRRIIGDRRDGGRVAARPSRILSYFFGTITLRRLYFVCITTMSGFTRDIESGPYQKVK
jgi:hypothetical protein